MKLAFLLALVMAKGLGELQALSSRVTSHDPAMSLASLPDFVAETESKGPPLPRSFLVRSLEEFVGDLPEGCLLCPVQAVWTYLAVMFSIAACFSSPSHLFSFKERSVVLLTAGDSRHWPWRRVPCLLRLIVFELWHLQLPF